VLAEDFEHAADLVRMTTGYMDLSRIRVPREVHHD
jgi:hypothetical protein